MQAILRIVVQCSSVYRLLLIYPLCRDSIESRIHTMQNSLDCPSNTADGIERHSLTKLAHNPRSTQVVLFAGIS